MARGFLASTMRSLSGALSRTLMSEETARQPGLMQSLDPRVRVIGTFALVIAVALAHRVWVVAVLFLVAVILAVVSRITLQILVLRVWLVVLAFTGVIALPALFLTPGDALTSSMSITRQGLHTAVMLILRVESAVTLTTVLVLSTAWPQILKALRALHVPKEAVMMLGMAHRYLFLLAETATQMFESRESRRVGALSGSGNRKVVAQTAGVLMSKSMDLSQEVFLAMQSRGYTGEVHVLADHRMSGRDYAALLAFLALAAVSAWVSR